MSGDEDGKPWWNRPLTRSARSGERRWTWRSTVGLVLIVLIFDALIGGNLIIILGLTCCGWVRFIVRVATEWRWSSAGIVSFVVFSLILLGGTHMALRWIRRAMAPAATPWAWRWTVRLAAMVLLLFAVGVAVVGIVHQTAWLVRDGAFRTQMPARSHSIIRQLSGMTSEKPMSPAQACVWLQARLPRWRVVVLPSGDQIGAIILAEEQGGTPGHVTVALPTPDRPGKFTPALRAKTTMAEQVAACEALLGQPGTVPRL